MLGLYGAEHSKCYRMITLGFKGLKPSFSRSISLYSHSVSCRGPSSGIWFDHSVFAGHWRW